MNNNQETLERLRTALNRKSLTPLRLKDWKKTVAWVIDEDLFAWTSDGTRFAPSSDKADITLKLSSSVLEKITSGEVPFFIALWATSDISFEGSFSDAYKMGYLFLSDNRSRRIVFLAHCFLNINPRFPEGAAYPGACTPLIQTLLDAGVGIIQMPCAEFRCLGPEKELYGDVHPEKLRQCFRKLAEEVVEDIRAYQNAGFEISGVIGMNPSPSCGVEITKGKETMLGTGRSTAEQKGNGVFIEEMMKIIKEIKLQNVPVFGVRRMLRGESGMEERLQALRERLG